MASVHVWWGAAAGSVMPAAPAAIAAGFASHAAGDMVPHRDAPPYVDTFAAVLGLGLIASRFGCGSREMLGALGGLVPDVEHVARKLGRPLTQRPLFPTHNRRLPHPRSRTYTSQIVCGALGILFVLRRPR